MLQTALKTTDRPTHWRDYAIAQNWSHFSSDDHRVWDILFERQVTALGSRVVIPFRDGLDLLRLSHPGVPDLTELNLALEPRTGWRTVAVPGLVPDAIFFAMLADKIFPIGNSSAVSASSTISTSPTCFTTFSAMCRCSATRAWRG